MATYKPQRKMGSTLVDVKIPTSSIDNLDKQSLFYVVGSSSQAGNSSSGSYLSTKWEGSIDGITALYDGLKISYRIQTNTGVSTAGAVLSINNLDYHPVVYNINSVCGTRYGVNSTIILTYNSTQTATAYLTSNKKTTVTGVWQLADYDADTKIREYQHGQDVAGTAPNYPILTRYNVTNKNGSYDTAYARFHTDVYINTDTGELSAPSIKQNGVQVLTSHQDISGKLDKDTTTNVWRVYANKNGTQGYYSMSQNPNGDTACQRTSTGALRVATPTADNEATTKAYVDSSIQNVAARFITADASGNPFATKSALTSATTFYYNGSTTTPTTNDYCVVLADEDHTISATGENPTTRYHYSGSQWNYQYIVNNSGLTAAQWSAVNSGITSTKVGTYDGYATTISGKLTGTKYHTNNPDVFIGYQAENNANVTAIPAFKGNNNNNGLCYAYFNIATNSAVAPSSAVNNGFYYVSSTTSGLSGADANPFLSLHTDNSDFRILTTAYSDKWLQQIATDFRSDKVYIRRKENGTWQNWKELGGASGNFVTLDTAQTITGTKTFNSTITGTNVVLTSGTPFTFRGVGSGTYNVGAFVCNTTDGIGFEAPMTTDSASGTKLPITFSWRGGSSSMGGFKVEGTGCYEKIGSNEWQKLATTSDVSGKITKSGDSGIGVLTPTGDGSTDFGSASHRWHYGYFRRLLAVESICNSTTYNVNQIMLPSKSGTMALTSDIPTSVNGLSGGTITSQTTIDHPSSDTPLYCRGSGGAIYIGFRNGDTLHGYIGMNSSQRPVFYDSAEVPICSKKNFSLSGTTLTITI